MKTFRTAKPGRSKEEAGRGNVQVYNRPTLFLLGRKQNARRYKKTKPVRFSSSRKIIQTVWQKRSDFAEQHLLILSRRSAQKNHVRYFFNMPRKLRPTKIQMQCFQHIEFLPGLTNDAETVHCQSIYRGVYHPICSKILDLYQTCKKDADFGPPHSNDKRFLSKKAVAAQKKGSNKRKLKPWRAVGLIGFHWDNNQEATKEQAYQEATSSASLKAAIDLTKQENTQKISGLVIFL